MATKRASLRKTLNFANKVREAGGANALEALMPSHPQEPSACLIANALNFDCQISGSSTWSDDRSWSMYLKGAKAIEKGRKIAAALKLEIREKSSPFYPQDNGVEIILPPEIGQVAHDFDKASEILNQKTLTTSEARRKLAVEMWPYIDPEAREDYLWHVKNGKLVKNEMAW